MTRRDDGKGDAVRGSALIGALDLRRVLRGLRRMLTAGGPVRLVLALGASAVIALCVATSMIVVQVRARELATARRDLGAFDNLLDEQTVQTIQGVNLLVSSIADELKVEGIATPDDLEREMNGVDTFHTLQSRTEGVPQLDAITLIAADGQLVNFSRYYPIPPVNVADRDYFKALRDAPSRETFLSRPVQNRGDGTWDIYLAHRIDGPHGEFVGLVLGAMQLRYFENLYRSITTGDSSAIALWRTDGTLLARFPTLPQIGQTLKAPATLTDVPTDRPVIADSVTGLDGVKRMRAERRLDDVPVVVEASRTMREVLSDWRHDAMVMVLASLACVAAILLLIAAMVRQFRAYEVMSSALAAREEAVQARMRAEERLLQAQKLESIGRLTSGIAHDFNNLLTSVRGNVELLLREPAGTADDATRARRLTTVLKAADQGAGLVRQLLAFARRESLSPGDVDVNALLRGMEELLAGTVGDAVRLRLRLDAALWLARVDPAQLERVVLNLASNARDAMPAGGELLIATGNTVLDSGGDLPAGEYVCLSLSDTGTGMTEEVRQQAFEPFFTTKPQGAGTGLGLSQVYGLARQSGGTVRIDSAPGAGTTVRVLLPRVVRRVRAEMGKVSERQASASL
jgi:signal transduction histidine kinase